MLTMRKTDGTAPQKTWDICKRKTHTYITMFLIFWSQFALFTLPPEDQAPPYRRERYVLTVPLYLWLKHIA